MRMVAVRVLKALTAFAGLALPAVVWAQSLPNPWRAAPANSASSTVVDIVIAAFIGFAGLMAFFAFGFLIFSAIKLLLAAGNEQAVEKGKAGITWAVGGFIVSVLSYSIVASVGAFLKGTNRNELASSERNILKPPTIDQTFTGAFTTVVNGMLGLAFLAAVVMVLYAGFRMISSAGNEQAVAQAKNILKWSMVAIVVIALAFSIIAGVNSIFT